MNYFSRGYPEFKVERDDAKCVRCQVCVRQCSYSATFYDEEKDKIYNDDHNCTGCQRCVMFCPTFCIDVREREIGFKRNAHWKPNDIRNINKQARTGGVLLSGMGSDKEYKEFWDKMLIDASQVTNPSIDPLREPMELKTFIGRKPDKPDLTFDKNGEPKLASKLSPQLELKYPIMFSAMSYGSINYNFAKALAMASKELGIFYNTGEGGLHETLYEYKKNTIVQVASGRFGVHPRYLKSAAAIEIKIGQGAKPGIGGHLPGEKIFGEIAATRMIPVGSDAISPAPHHDIYSIEDLRQLIYALKEATNYEKPISVKIAAVHNAPAIASGIIRAGADIIVLDGFRGGTGAAPTMIRDNVGIPIEMALASVDQRLRDEGIRGNASLIVTGGFRNSADVIKAIALGADAVYIASSAAIAVGCTLCQKCYMGKCAWGITTNRPDLMKRLNPEIAAEQLVNLVTGWGHEMEEILGGMGLNAIESLRGNRLKLRGIGLNEVELETLGILPAGR